MACQRMPRRRFLKTALAGATAASVASGAARSFAQPAGTGAPAAAAAAAVKPKIPLSVLGKTGQQIPRLLQGTTMDFTAGLLKTAYEQGVTYFDTADCYGGGQSEKTIGNFLERSGLRKQIWITTKSCAHDPKGMEQRLATSLERLRTDWVDLFFLHNLSELERLDASMRQTIDRLKKSGKIRFFGFSTHSPNVSEALTHAASIGWIDAIMFKYNFRAYGDAELNRAMDTAKSASIGLIAMKTQGSAFSFQNKVDAFRAKGFSQHQAALKAVWNDDRIDAAVSEMKNVQQLEQNCTAARDLTRLGALQIEELQQYAQATSHLYCRGCDHLCRAALPRPVAVGDMMRLLMYHDEYGELERARRLYGELPAELRNLEGLDLDSAARACPHGLNVAALLNRASRVLKS